MESILNLSEREILTLKREKLDEDFKIKYPNGQFCIQIRYGEFGFGSKSKNICSYGLYWNKRRRTSYCSYIGVSVNKNNNSPFGQDNNIHTSLFQNNAFKYCYYADNINSFINMTNRHNIPKEMVNVFIECFNKKEDYYNWFEQIEKETDNYSKYHFGGFFQYYDNKKSKEDNLKIFKKFYDETYAKKRVINE